MFLISYDRSSGQKHSFYKSVSCIHLFFSKMFSYPVSLTWCSVDTEEKKQSAQHSYRMNPWIHAVCVKLCPCCDQTGMLTFIPFGKSFPVCCGDDIPIMAASRLFWGDRVKTGTIFRCRCPSISRFDLLSDLRFPSAHHCSAELCLSGVLSALTNLVILLLPLLAAKRFCTYVLLMARLWLKWSHCGK